MPNLQDDRVPKPKGTIELNQEAIMEALAKIATAVGTLETKVTNNHAEVVKWVRAGRFNG